MRGPRTHNAPSMNPLALASTTHLKVLFTVLSAFTGLFCSTQVLTQECGIWGSRSQQLTTRSQYVVICKVCCYERLQLHVTKALCRLIWPIYLMLQCIFKFKWQLKAQGTDLIIIQVFFPSLFSFSVCCYNKLACCVMGLGSWVFSPTPSINVRSTEEQSKSTLLSRKGLLCSSQTI